jgi:hypothetical protein
VQTSSGQQCPRAVGRERIPDDEQVTFDDLAEAEEALPSSAAVMLMENEIQRLDELVALSDGIVQETKIERLLEMIHEDFAAEEPVLLFTEYKATQALVVNALQLLNGVALRTGNPAESDPSVVEPSSVVARLEQAFDGELGARAPTLRRPVSWPEILLLPVGQG